MQINPFQAQTNKPFIAIKSRRNGYLQLSESRSVVNYSELSPNLLLVAKAWATKLEEFGAKRVYWIIYSEQVSQIHIHLFPRWTDEEARGADLFATRNENPQPAWTEKCEEGLFSWAEQYQVFMLEE